METNSISRSQFKKKKKATKNQGTKIQTEKNTINDRAVDRLNSRREGTEETVSELEERTAEISQPVQHQENKWRALRDLRNYDKKSTSKWLQSWRKRTKKAQVKKYSNIMAENVPNLARDKPTDLSWANVTQDIPQATNAKVKVLVTQSCLILCDPMDCSPPGSSVRGISQARIL